MAPTTRKGKLMKPGVETAQVYLDAAKQASAGRKFDAAVAAALIAIAELFVHDEQEAQPREGYL